MNQEFQCQFQKPGIGIRLKGHVRKYSNTIILVDQLAIPLIDNLFI